MSRSSSLSEPEAGISCFASSLPGFRGVLKHRYTDFIVHEVARDGALVRLSSFDLPTECVDVTEEEKAAPSTDADHSQALESFRALCGDVDYDAVKGLLERSAAGGDSDVSPVILSPDADKAHRSEVHNFFKRNFKFLVTDTVEHNDGIKRCIRVRLGSGAGGGRGSGGRGRKRKNMGGSGWRDDRPYDSRGSSNWSDHVGKFLRFHLYKENKDTQEALGVIGKMLGLQSRSFGFAGTKDKRAVTTQQVTVFKVQANRLAALNNRLFGIKVGNFCYVKEGLVLGQLMGNRFTITLRGVVAESEDIIKTAVDGLGKNGFINYYGLQRFGSGSVPTHLVGAALLRGEWKTAVNLILDPREGERDDINEARKHYKEHGDIDKALRNLPRHLVAERAILQCLKKCPGNYLQALKGIPRTLRMMYVHSYQSYLWNHAASMRVEKYGISQVVEGDLVYNKECPPGEGTSIDTSEADDGNTNSSEIDLCSEAQPEEAIQSMKKVDSEDLLKEVYTFDDVVLPLPGSQALFPGNEVAEIYHEMARKDGISLTENAHGVKEFSITSMKGGYRRVFQRPIDFEWELMTYTDDSSSLAETDLDILSGTKPTEANELVSSGISDHQSQDKLERPSDTSVPTNGSSFLENKPIGSPDTLPRKLAIKLAFTLPASSYATMAIRELLKTSTSVAYQKTLNC
ncbi:multisubstrate pseudouridine synthase 7-like isoform X2 [Phragmites australis]|uniref:multisubstrate pseudouridine synthase 7-like isoform X2 n=1 Tax=Phragmites australis TaxID=29695 RepID=UPI002D7849A9|nr:multisubstrate pseudouridine synthase 7-like isoform X2 [Phragmites australis]